jgi:hypothetical protein
MSTRAQVRFATREDGVSFSEHPDKINAQFYVHSDGYPEGLGLDIADSLVMNNNPALQWEIEELQTQHGDLDYIYYIWQKYDDDTWISIFEVSGFGYTTCKTCGQEVEDYDGKQVGKCIFVGTPEKLLTKYGSQEDESYYKLNTNNDG